MKIEDIDLLEILNDRKERVGYLTQEDYNTLTSILKDILKTAHCDKETRRRFKNLLVKLDLESNGGSLKIIYDDEKK